MPSPAFPCSYLLLLKIAHFKFHKLTLKLIFTLLYYLYSSNDNYFPTLNLLYDL